MLTPKDVEEYVQDHQDLSDTEIAKALQISLRRVVSARRRITPKHGRLTQTRLGKAMLRESAETVEDLRLLFGEAALEETRQRMLQCGVLLADGSWSSYGIAWARQGFTGAKCRRQQRHPVV